jgi:hypothetical protein
LLHRLEANTEYRRVMTGSDDSRFQAPELRGDRRSHHRQLAVMRAALVEIGEITHFCRIVNVSPAGLELRLYRSAEPGTRVLVRLPSETCIDGTIIWARGNAAGIRLDTELDTTVLIGTESFDPKARRRMPRAMINRDGFLRVESVVYPVTVLDISPAGARTRSATPPAPRGPASLRLPGLEAIGCRICWINDSDAGLKFNSPIEMRTLAEWIKGLEHDAGFRQRA